MAEAGATRYDAFVSYSHAADDLLAPRLQAGLQRFAKPWWRRRAVRVFRDESSLSASPHLWGSITEALDSSSWFVLLLSPEAASSEWVNKEIDYWKSDPSRVERVLPVVTDGEFAWDGDVAGDAVPPSLRGVFSSEPRWVDLRFAKGETQLDLKNPDFAAAVADIASAIRGIPKDELESEEVKQHRRTIRTAWAAGILVLLLGVAASVAAVFALNEQTRANQNADRANQEADRATSEADRANQNAVEAEAQRAEAEAAAKAEAVARQEAERAAALAQGREIVLEAENAIDVDPQLSLHLALFAVNAFLETQEDPARAISILRDAVSANRAALRLPGSDALTAHPFEPLLATIEPGGGVLAIRDVTGGEVVESHSITSDVGAWCSISFSDDGRRLALAGFDGDDRTPVTVLDRATGESTRIDAGGCGVSFSPDGGYLAWNRRADGNPVVEIWSTSEERVTYRSPCCAFSRPDFNANGLLAYVPGGGGNEVILVDPVERRVVRRLGFPNPGVGSGTGALWSPDGSKIAAIGSDSVVVLDVVTGRVVGQFDGRNPNASWLPSSQALVVGDQAGVVVIDANSGDIRMMIPGLASSEFAAIPGTGLVAAIDTTNAGAVVLFDTFPAGGVEVGGWITPLQNSGWARFVGDGERVLITDRAASYVVADALDGGHRGLVEGPASVLTGENLVVSGDGRYVASWGTDGFSTIRSTADLSVVFSAPQGWEVQGLSWDASVAVINSDRLPLECEEAYVVFADDGEVIADLSSQVSSCVTGEGGGEAARWHFSPDGSAMVAYGAMMRVDSALRVFNQIPFQETSPVVFSADGRLILSAGEEGSLVVYDFEQLSDGASPPTSLVASISAHDGSIADITVSSDGTMATTSAYGEPVRLWDLTSGRLVAEFGGPPERDQSHYAAFHPTKPWLLVVSPPNEVRIYTLDLGELIAIAEARLTRDMTEEECQQYFRSSCAEAFLEG